MRWLRGLGWPVGVLLAAMVAYLAVRRDVDGPAEVAAAVALAGGGVGLAAATGSRADDLGLSVRRLGPGVAWGLGVGGAAAAALLVTSLVPIGEDFFADDRFSGLSGGEVAFEALVRVPLATALVEELVFRGALLAMVERTQGRVAAVVLSSAVFGLWHAVDASGFADANQGFGSGGAWVVVPVTVVVTALAGAGLAWLRYRSGSLAAPVIVHATVNATALLLSASGA